MQLVSTFMLEAMPEHLIGDRAYDSDGLDNDPRQDGVNMIARTGPRGNSRSKTVAICGGINAAGSSSASLPGCNGSGAS